MRVAAWLVPEPSQNPVALSPGDLIGRSATAALRIDDGRVSEAHAMVSLRGGSLWLLALRGRLRQHGRTKTEVRLSEGAEVELAEGLMLRCEALELPDEVLGVQLDDGPVGVLVGTTSVVAGPPGALRQGFDGGADAVLWSIGSAWRIALRGEEPMALEAGADLRIGGVRLRALAVPVGTGEQPRTRGSLREPAIWDENGDAVRVRAGADTVEIGGVQGRILGRLLRYPAGVAWRDVAADLWADDGSPAAALRNRLDVNLVKIRERLRRAGISDVRLTMDGAGLLRLELPPDDRRELDDTPRG